MNVGFELDSNPLKIDLSGAAHSHVDRMNQTSNRVSSCSSSRSSEFQAVLEALSDYKINEPSTKGNDSSAICSNEKGDSGQQSLVDSSSGSAISKFNRAPPMLTRRKSLPSLGLVAVDVQYSVPSSKSFPADLSKNIAGKELDVILETPRKGKQKPHHLENSLTRQEGRRRRFSLGAQGNEAPSKSRTVVPKTKQRRPSCSKFAESPSVWRVQVHKRSLDINDEDDRLYSRFQTRRGSFAGFSTVADQSEKKQSLLPKIGRRNSLVQNDDEE